MAINRAGMIPFRKAAGATIALALCLVWSAAAEVGSGDQRLDNLARELVRLRGEVDSLVSELSLKRVELRDRVQFLNAQKADLEAQVNREELRVKQLRQTLEAKQERMENRQVTREDLRPLVNDQVAKVRSYIEGSLPFKRKERLSELDKMVEMLEAKTLSPEKALAQLWSLIEDEFRLVRENGLYRQIIDVQGKEQLVDVVRIGMVLLYFRTSEGKVGQTIKTASGYEFRVTEDKKDVKRIKLLFDSMEKRIREGYFELPIAR